ncbi:MAG TPA: hypothetical protein PK425_02410 [Syntrophales bacterium]|jgi:hypothetical protein|nr:hypothetical protein [Syntrophales bacterium]HPX55368.1 hypothetical protein [Syntrophales bacterium]
MKSIQSMIFFFLLFSLLLVNPEIARSENWVKYGEYPDGSVLSYDQDSIGERTRYIKQVWFRRDVSSQGREKLIQRMKDQGFPVEGYDRLSHHVVLFVMNCREMKSKALSTIDYDTEGKELFRNSSIDQPDWDDIKQNNPMMFGLYEILCKSSPQNNDERN